MHSKNHRQNHDFQIAHFLAGKCQTPDGAYAMLCDLKEEREAAIAHYHVSQKRTQAKELRAQQLYQTTLRTGDDPTRLEAQADLEEIENGRKTGRILYEAAVDELNFIKNCIELIQPHRKWAHLSDPEAHEAAQREEWGLELIERAENYLFCTNTIPADELSTMRSHPDFAEVILPAIKQIRQQLEDKDVEPLLVRKKDSLAALLAPAKKE
jgi:hypothetical protein